MEDKNFIYYTDGAATMKKIDGKYVRCAGGWAWARVNEHEDVVATDSDGDWETTNNEMELYAILMAIRNFEAQCLSGCTVKIHSDSAYSINCLTQWCAGWERNGWTRGAKHEKIENLEIIKSIWESLKDAENNFNKIEFVKVKGHAGNKINELVDSLAVESKIKYSKE